MEKRGDRRPKKTKKSKKLRIFLLSILFIFLFSIGFGGIYAYKLLNKVSSSGTIEDTGITDEAKTKIEEVDKKGEIINIALFGIDQRDLKERGRSDSIIILTIDKTHKKIKLSSIMRDSYVAIDGHGKDKITHAYAFGGPELAVKTLNQNFNLNIKDYATVNFFGLAKIIDSLGGVTIDVKKDEVPIANDYIREISELENIKPVYLKNPGTQTLTGIQAVAYARNRYSGNGDYERTDRQRRVLSALMEKIENISVTKYPSLVSELLPYVITSMDGSDIAKLGTEVISTGTKTIDQERFPIDGYCQSKMINGVYYLTYDENATKDQMFKYIYQDIKPVSK